MFDLSRVGHHFIIGLRPTTDLHPQDRELLRDLKPAGVILFKSNFVHERPYEEWLENQKSLIASIREAINRDQLFVAIDHEGGRVCRTPSPMTRFTYAQRWGSHAARIGNAMGIELASLGINLNFAPVLDVDSNPNNPVIGLRSFDRDPDVVTERAREFMRELERAGVRACGKHFPGHGDTNVDSHLELPVLGATAETLRHRELKPFAGAIAEGIGMIMTSHILFRDLDRLSPATLSPRIVSGLLRAELGFKGVVVSDDIGMRAVSALFDDKAAVLRFLSAGNDMLMICAHWTDTERARFLATSLLEALTSGELDHRIMERSRERIETMLHATQQHSVRQLSAGALQEHAAAGPIFTDRTVEVT